MTAASDAIRQDRLCSRVDAFLELETVSHVMLLNDGDIPDEELFSRCHHEARAIKAELMAQRNVECARRLILIDEVIKKVLPTVLILIGPPII